VKPAAHLARPSHDDLDDPGYVASIESTAGDSAPATAESLVRDIAPNDLLDAGCGTGPILHECVRRGIRGRGLEYSEAAIAYRRRRGLEAERFDLGTDRLSPPERPYDVALSTEVAEHLTERMADAFVDAPVSEGRLIVFTAATLGQRGRDYVNEQPQSYWIAKFAARGVTLDGAITACSRDEWRGMAAPWYADNAMVFRRSG
jgi:cyclopropane fatty-acyl-phospholipid synthase-like methyltransferase